MNRSTGESKSITIKNDKGTLDKIELNVHCYFVLTGEEELIRIKKTVLVLKLRIKFLNNLT